MLNTKKKIKRGFGILLILSFAPILGGIIQLPKFIEGFKIGLLVDACVIGAIGFVILALWLFGIFEE